MKKLALLLFMLCIMFSTSTVYATEDEELPEFDLANAISFVDDTPDTGISLFATKPVSYKLINIPMQVYKKSNSSDKRSYKNVARFSYNGIVAYCLQPLTIYKSAGSYSASDFLATDSYTAVQKEQVQLIAKYGYTYPGHKTDKYYLAAQKLIWEVLDYQVYYYSDTNYSKSYSVKTEETEIKRLIDLDKIYPSFSGKKYTLEVGKSITITDDNQVLQDFEIDKIPDGITVTKTSNSLSISSTKKAKGKITFKQGANREEHLTLNIAKSSNSQNLVIYPDGSVDNKIAELNIDSYTYGDGLISKVDAWTNEKLPNVTFNISSNKNMSNPTTYITNTKGEIVLTHFETGTYYYRETSTLDNYVLDETIRSFTIVENQEVAVLIKNEPIKSNVTLNKTIEGDSIDAKLEGKGFTFSFKRLDKQQEIITITTDKDGIATTQLPYGEYQVSETHVSGYQIKKPWNITINGKETSLEVHNNKSRRDVKIIKIDAITKKPIILANATFEITFNDAKLINPLTQDTLFTTDETGSFTVPQLLSGVYNLHEIAAPNGYLPLNKPVPFEVVDGATVFEVYLENQAQLGEIQVMKTGQRIQSFEITKTEYGDLYSPITNYLPLQNARYELRAKTDIVGMDGTLHYQQGQVVKDDTTDKNGDLTFTNLPLGTYELEETAAPYGYQLDSTIYTIKITADNTQTTVSKQIKPKNNFKIKEVTFSKVFESSLFISKQESISKTVFGLYNKNPIKQNEVELVPANQLMGILTLDDDGNFTVKLLVENEYYLKELTTHSSYDITSNIKFSYSGGIVNVSDLKITNSLKRVNFQINKSSLKKKHPLQGATFGLYPSKNPNELLQEKTSDEKGIVIFDNLELGEYLVKELVAPPGYQLLNNPIKITVTDENNLNQIAINNDTIPKTGVPSNNNYWGLLGIIPLGIIGYFRNKRRR